MSEMIDDNIIEWSEVSKQVELVKKDNEKLLS